MSVVDWVIVGVYALSTLVLGVYFSRRQRSMSEYFVGSGRMNPLLIGVSLFATLLSTISYLAIPGEIIGKGPAYLAIFLAYPFVFVFLAVFIIPVYMRQRVTSAYELLEEHLGLSVRLLGVALFLALRLVWMSLLVFLTAKALVIIVGLEEKWVPWMALATGAFAITYTSIGGLRAVVMTDLLQSILLYGGALLVIGTVTLRMQGLGWIPTEWQDVWDKQPLFSLDPATRITLLGSFLTMFLWLACTAAGDQVSIQRFMATEDAKAARQAVAVQLALGFVVGITLIVVGLAVLGFYQKFPNELPENITLSATPDKAFPHFIAHSLPPVVTGLVVAGLFAAAMSSVDSGVNSIAAVVLTDLLDRFQLAPESEHRHVQFARMTAVVVGVTVVAGSSLMEYVPGNFMAVTNKTVSLFTVPLFLLFFFALYVERANPVGVWIGVMASTTASVLVAFSGLFFGVDPATGNDPISFQWISPVALVVGVSVGWVACYLTQSLSSPPAAKRKIPAKH